MAGTRGEDCKYIINCTLVVVVGAVDNVHKSDIWCLVVKWISFIPPVGGDFPNLSTG